MPERNHNNFSENLKFAQEGEVEVGEMLKLLFNGLIVKSYNNDKDCDIVCEWKGNPLLVEVKEDVRCSDTGNVIIEYKSRGKPSGISTSKSDIWILKIHHGGKINFLMYSLKTLKGLIESKMYKDDFFMRRTDSNNNVYRFKYDVLLDNCDYHIL